jgi:hypothetical protein
LHVNGYGKKVEFAVIIVTTDLEGRGKCRIG